VLKSDTSITTHHEYSFASVGCEPLPNVHAITISGPMIARNGAPACAAKFGARMVIAWTFRQWLAPERWQMNIMVSSILVSDFTPNPASPNYKTFPVQGWTTTHGYFIQMGGFTLYKGETSQGLLQPRKWQNSLKRGKSTSDSFKEKRSEDRAKATAFQSRLQFADSLCLSYSALRAESATRHHWA